MIPKMPEKVPRSCRANQAALILIMPGAPQDWNQPLRMAINPKVARVPTKDEKPKMKLQTMVPAAPMSMEVLPPIRSASRPLTS